MLRYLVTLLIMVIRWPTPVPFTSKDKVTHQINCKITMSKERGNEHERLLSRLNVPSYLLHFKTKHPCYFQNKYQHFQKNIFQNLKTFSKDPHFVYNLTNENHYKVCLNKWPLFKILSKPQKAQFQTKASDLANN